MKPVPPDAPDMTGTHYELRGLLGEGGFGAAYLAFDRKLRRTIVLKFLLDISNPGFVARFQREAQVMAGLDDETIPSIFEISSTPKQGIPFIAMEFIDGKSLGEHLFDEGNVLPQAEACRIVADAAAGLATAHEAGVVHRDIKLANILIDKRKRVKIIDFGIARMTVEESREATPKMLTRKNEIIGTPRYMSPEQCRAEAVGPASDLYSLGVVLFMLLTGASPFDGNNQEMMLGHVTKPPPKLADVAGRPFPMSLEHVVARLLDKDPNARFATGHELAAALRGATRVPRDASMTSQAFDDRTGKPVELEAAAPVARVSSPGFSPEPSATSPAPPVAVRRSTQVHVGDSIRSLAKEPSVFVAPISATEWNSIQPSNPPQGIPPGMAPNAISFEPTLAAPSTSPTAYAVQGNHPAAPVVGTIEMPQVSASSMPYVASPSRPHPEVTPSSMQTTMGAQAMPPRESSKKVLAFVALGLVLAGGAATVLVISRQPKSTQSTVDSAPAKRTGTSSADDLKGPQAAAVPLATTATATPTGSTEAPTPQTTATSSPKPALLPPIAHTTPTGAPAIKPPPASISTKTVATAVPSETAKPPSPPPPAPTPTAVSTSVVDDQK